MTRVPDILVRVIFEVHFRGKDRVPEIQNRISAFSSSCFHALLTEGLSRVAKDRLLVFERIEFDVGRVRVARLEHDLSEGIAGCLRRWAFTIKPPYSLPLQLDSQSVSPGSDHARPHLSSVSPSEATKTLLPATTGLNAAIAAALEQPGGWPEFLDVLRHNHALRCRMADEVSPKLLRRLVNTLFPGHGSWISGFAESAFHLQNRKPFVQVNVHVFRRELWVCILDELVALPSTQLLQSSFVGGVFRRMAARTSSSHSEIAANLRLALDSHFLAIPDMELLAAAVRELSAEAASTGLDHSSVASVDSAGRDVESSRRLDDLAKFLELGALPWSLTSRGPEVELLELLASTPKQVCRLVQELSRIASVRKRISIQLSESANRRLLMALDPVAATWMISCVHQLRQLHAQKPFFPVQSREFAQELWELCFEYLAERPSRNFNLRSFFRFLLLRLARRRSRSYESLLSDLLLRRSPEPEVRRFGAGSDAAIENALLGLLDHAIVDHDELAPEVSHFLIDPDRQHSYSDLDVLAHWLRWRKLPRWSHATDPEETGLRLGSLLHGLPQDTQAYALRTTARGIATTNPDRSEAAAAALTPAEELRHWLSFGLWPLGVAAPDSSQLEIWLRGHTDADWLRALEGSRAQEAMITRISHHLSPALFERITRLLAGHAAGLVWDYLRCLDAAGRRTAPVAIQIWTVRLRKYTLMCLLRASSSSSGRHAISVALLARNATLALALSCRVPYERLLDAVQHESQGRQHVQNLCRDLSREIETDREDSAAMAPDITTPDPGSSASPDPLGLLRHYLQHGLMPEGVPQIGFTSLRQLAGRLSIEQISRLSQECSRAVRTNHASARRAAILFSRASFIRFAHPTFASEAVLTELEDAIVRLAPRLSTPAGPLLTETRIFQLQHPMPPRPGATQNALMKAVLSELIREMATFTGASSELIFRELRAIAGRNTVLADVLADAHHDACTPEQPGAAERATAFPEPAGSAQSTVIPNADSFREAVHKVSTGDLPERIASLGAFLRTGLLPDSGNLLVQESSHDWICPGLSGNPHAFLKMLRSVSARPGALDRLIRYVEQNDLEQIVRAAAPEYGGMLLLYIDVGSGCRNTESSAGRTILRSKAAAIHWQQALALLLDEHQATLSPAQALRELTLQVSRLLSMTHDAYVAIVAHAARRRQSESTGFTALAEMLEQLLPARSMNSVHEETAGVTHSDFAGRSSSANPAFAVPPAPEAQQETKETHISRNLRTAEAGPVPTAESAEASESADHRDAVLELPAPDDALRQLAYFLRYGQLAKTAPDGDRELLMASVTKDLDIRPIEYRAYLLQAAGREIERKRMAAFLPSRLLSRFWPLLAPAPSSQVSLCVELVEEGLPVSSTGTLRESCWEIIVEELFLAIASGQGSRWDEAAFIRAAIERLAGHLSLRPVVLVKRVRTALERKPPAMRATVQPLIDRVERETAALPPLRKLSLAPERSRPQVEKAPKTARAMPEGETFYIGNAGLVLLWPFLQTYFQKLDLVEKQAFRDEQAQTRAIYLMQHLATGALEAEEHQLLLNKILAGAAPEQPLESPAPIAENEAALSDQLLQGVLSNWEKLKNTSIEGLRASFLVREGKLMLKDDAWWLTVTPQSYDLLLGSLPWRLTMIRLPWMRTLLQVKWR